MRSVIRAKLYEKQEQMRSRQAPPTHIEALDRQTVHERKQRETAAKVEAWRLQKKLAEAQPVPGSHCRQKACPFPAVMDGECRAHAMDRHAQASTIPSQLALTVEAANKMGYWS